MLDKALSRREWHQLVTAGCLGFSATGFLGSLARASENRRPVKSCILLWMDGGPSHIDTFDPKASNPFQAIPTSVPGVHISETLPRVARLMHHGILLRGMSTPDANHPTARVLMHSGFRNASSGGVAYPVIGSLIASELGRPDAPLPNYVVTGIPRFPKYNFLTNTGFLGSRHAPLVINDLDRGVENLRSPVGGSELEDRLSVLEQMERGFLQRNPSTAADSHRATLQRAVQLMRSQGAGEAFDLDREPIRNRQAYGDHYFGRGCLLARRLVEVGVPFVEVYLPDWDTHSADRAETIRTQTLPQLDQTLSTLIADLRDRGLLDSTLIVWMGEFGRSPVPKAGGARDHYSRAWSTALFGGGLRTGQVIGATNALGATVTDRPIGVGDFMATLCELCGIDPQQRKVVNERPVPLVDRGAAVIREIVPGRA